MPQIPLLPPQRLNDDVSNAQNGTDALNAVFTPSDSAGRFVLSRRGGLWAWWTCGLTNGIDGLYWWENKQKLIAVCGGRIFVFSDMISAPIEISSTAVRLTINEPVEFETNGNWLFMCNGWYIVAWDGSSATAEFLTARPKASSLAFLNTSVLANEEGSSRVRYSEPQPLEQLTTPDWASGYFSPEANPDKLVAIKAKWGELLLFGPRSVEFWYYSGSSPVPFNRIEGAYLERGVLAPKSIVAFDNSWFWFDSERKITRLSGRTPEVISIPYDRTIRAIDNIADARGFAVDNRFYVLCFPSNDLCIAYDTYSKAWSKWTWFNTETGLHERFFGQCSVYVPEWAAQFVGGRRDGRVLLYHQNLVTDFFNPIRFEYYTAHLDWGTLEWKQSNKLLMRMRRGA
jgi:hypothetical protein